MASKGSSTAPRKLPKNSMYTREFSFHICGGDHLSVIRADTHPLWKDIPEATSQDKHYHTIQCAEMTRLQSGRSINDGDISRLKDKLRNFFKVMETRQVNMSFRYEARFGHLFVYSKDQISGSIPGPVTTRLLKGPTFGREFVTRLVSQCDIEAFKQEHCEMIVNHDVITYKINFTQHLDGMKFCGVCYIEEKAGSFTLLGVHDSSDEIIGVKIDIIRPGRTYDIRVASGVHNYNEDNIVPDCMKTVAERITTSLTRSSFNQREIRLQVVSENFEVNYIRESKTHEYKWKRNPRWVFVEHDIQQLNYKEENHRILKRDKQFHPVPIAFTDCRKEIELWSKVHCQPDGTNRWSTEQMMAGFDEFVGTCFDIAGLLDDSVSVPQVE